MKSTSDKYPQAIAFIIGQAVSIRNVGECNFAHVLSSFKSSNVLICFQPNDGYVVFFEILGRGLDAE